MSRSGASAHRPNQSCRRVWSPGFSRSHMKGWRSLKLAKAGTPNPAHIRLLQARIRRQCPDAPGFEAMPQSRNGIARTIAELFQLCNGSLPHFTYRRRYYCPRHMQRAWERRQAALIMGEASRLQNNGFENGVSAWLRISFVPSISVSRDPAWVSAGSPVCRTGWRPKGAVSPRAVSALGNTCR